MIMIVVLITRNTSNHENDQEHTDLRLIMMTGSNHWIPMMIMGILMMTFDADDDDDDI